MGTVAIILIVRFKFVNVMTFVLFQSMDPALRTFWKITDILNNKFIHPLLSRCAQYVRIL